MSDPKTRFLVLRVAVVLGVAAVMILSLPLEAARFTPGSNELSWPGLAFMTCGFMGGCNPTPLWGWFGNPLWLLGLLLVAFGRRPAIAAMGTALFALGLLVALDSLRLSSAGLAPNEGGVVTHHLAAFGPGFYVWLTSFVVGILGGAVVMAVAVRMRHVAN